MQHFEPFALTTFCNDIRYEVGGKHSLIGVYRDDIILHTASFPTTLPKLALAIMLVEHPSRRTLPMEVRVTVPGQDAPHFTAHIDPQLEPEIDAPTERRRYLSFHIMISPVPFAVPGMIKVRLHREDRIIKAGTLVVRSQEPPQPPQIMLGSNGKPLLGLPAKG